MKIPKHLQKRIERGESISSKEYREMLMKSKAKSSATVRVGKNREEKSKLSSIVDSLSYQYKIETFQDDDAPVYKVTLDGRNFSRNSINSMSFRDALKYKAKIKQSAETFWLMNKKMFPLETLKKVTIHYKIYCVKSRDYDNNDTKTLQDTFTILGLIEDDNRKVVLDRTEEEIIAKRYKIEAFIKKRT